MPTPSPSARPHFSDLPPELRNRVWELSLPPKDGPALFFYRRGCWQPRWLTSYDEGYDPDDPSNLNLEFQHWSLEPVQVHVPLFFVNREARGFALAWMRKHGIRIRLDRCEQRLIFVRHFEPEYDVMYVAPERFSDICCEPHDRMFEPDLLNQTINTGPDLRYIAFGEDTVRDHPEDVMDVLNWFTNCRAVIVVVNEQSTLGLDDGVRSRWRCELENIAAWTFVWDDKKGQFEWSTGREIAGAMHVRIAEACKVLSERLVRAQPNPIELRPAFIVTR